MSATKTTASSPSSSSPRKKKGHSVCRFFNTSAGCKEGSSCRFAHVLDRDGSAIGSPTSVASSASLVVDNKCKNIPPEPSNNKKEKKSRRRGKSYKKPCRNGPSCTDVDCPYVHDNKDSSSPVVATTAKKKAAEQQLNTSEGEQITETKSDDNQNNSKQARKKRVKKCKYGSECRTKNCKYRHPAGTNKPENGADGNGEVEIKENGNANSKTNDINKENKDNCKTDKLGQGEHITGDILITNNVGMMNGSNKANGVISKGIVGKKDENLEHLAQDLLSALQNVSTDDPKAALNLASELLQSVNHSSDGSQGKVIGNKNKVDSVHDHRRSNGLGSEDNLSSMVSQIGKNSTIMSTAAISPTSSSSLSSDELIKNMLGIARINPAPHHNGKAKSPEPSSSAAVSKHPPPGFLTDQQKSKQQKDNTQQHVSVGQQQKHDEHGQEQNRLHQSSSLKKSNEESNQSRLSSYFGNSTNTNGTRSSVDELQWQHLGHDLLDQFDDFDVGANHVDGNNGSNSAEAAKATLSTEAAHLDDTLAKQLKQTHQLEQEQLRQHQQYQQSTQYNAKQFPQQQSHISTQQSNEMGMHHHHEHYQQQPYMHHHHQYQQDRHLHQPNDVTNTPYDTTGTGMNYDAKPFNAQTYIPNNDYEQGEYHEAAGAAGIGGAYDQHEYQYYNSNGSSIHAKSQQPEKRRAKMDNIRLKAEAKAKAKAEAEAHAKAEKARLKAEAESKAEEEKKAAAEQARLKAEAKAKVKAEAKAAEKARKLAEAKARLEEEAKAAEEARLKVEADKESEAQALAEAEAKKQQEREKLARMREEARKQQAAAKERKMKEKSKKAQRRQKELEDQESNRNQMWDEEIATEKEYINVLIELSAAEFVRQNKNSLLAKASKLTTRKIKSDESAMEKLSSNCMFAYRELFQHRVKSRVSLAGLDKDLNGRTGTIRFWDESKEMYCIGLDTKKGINVEIRYFKPGNLDAVPTQTKSGKKDKPIDRYVLEISNLFMNQSLSFAITVSVVEAVKNANNTDEFLTSLMEKRDALEKQRKIEEDEEKRREAEDRKRRAEHKAKENAAWEARKARLDEERKEYEEFQKEYKRQQRKERKRYSHGFSMGGGCPCYRCQMEARFRDYSFFEFFYGFDRDDDDDGSDYGSDGEDFEDFDARWSRKREEEREAETRKQANILGVPADASPSMIKSVYRTKALQFHPDKFRQDSEHGMTKKDATEHFLKIQNAYDHLMSNFDD